MAHKIFASYKFGDNQVYQGLDQKYWAEDATEATVRGYVNWIEEVVGRDNIYKGESDGEPLSGKTDDQIWEYLKPMVHDSTVTLVVISPEMKNVFEAEKDQWIPQEVRYSLWEVERGDKTSTTNALLGVVLPDRNNSYDYVWSKSNCAHCQHIPILNKEHFFNILKGNIFNKKGDDGMLCQGATCYSRIYDGDHSYLHLVSFQNFIDSPSMHLDKALEIQDKNDEYEIEKSI